MSNLILGTLNLCLGLKWKKDLIKSLLNESKIDILAMQEVEIEPVFDLNSLRIPGYNLEVENGYQRRRTAIYIKNNLNTIEHCVMRA